MSQPPDSMLRRGPMRTLIQRPDGRVEWHPVEAFGDALMVDGLVYAPKWHVEDDATGGWIRFFVPSETG